MNNSKIKDLATIVLANSQKLATHDAIKFILARDGIEDCAKQIIEEANANE